MSKISTGLYRHYKGAMYELIGVSEQSDHYAQYAVLRDMGGKFHVRLRHEFLESLSINGASVPRFAFLQSHVPPPCDPEMVKAAHAAFERGDYMTTEEYADELRKKISRRSRRAQLITTVLTASGWILAIYLAFENTRLTKIIDSQPKIRLKSTITGKEY